jgi:hypothetical protein
MNSWQPDVHLFYLGPQLVLMVLLTYASSWVAGVTYRKSHISLEAVRMYAASFTIRSIYPIVWASSVISLKGYDVLIQCSVQPPPVCLAGIGTCALHIPYISSWWCCLSVQHILCRIRRGCPEDGGSMFLQSVSNHLQDYMVLYPRRPLSLPWKPKILCIYINRFPDYPEVSRVDFCKKY